MAAALEILKAQGRRQTWLAERLGVSQSHLWRQLAGERPISAERAALVASALGVPLSVLNLRIKDAEPADQAATAEAVA